MEGRRRDTAIRDDRDEPAAPESLARADWRTIAGILAALVFAFLSLGFVFTVLPLYVRGPVGASNGVVGFVMGATGAAAFVSRPFAGRLAERRGRRNVMVAGCALVALAGVLYHLPAGLPGLFAARLVLGVGEAAVFTAAAVWIVSMAPPDRRGQLVGFAGLAMWTGFTVGPVVGGIVLERWSFGTVWTLSAVAPLVGALVATFVPDPHERVESERGALLPAVVVRPGAALALAAIGYATLNGFIVLFLRSRDIGEFGRWTLFAYGATYVGTRVLAGRLPDRLGPQRVALWSGVVEAAGLVVIATATEPWTAIAGGLVMGAGFSLLYPSLALIVVQQAQPAEQGAALGAYTSFWDLGLLVGQPTAGLLIDGVGYPGAFVASAALACVAAALAFSDRS
ncbi:MAG TPA: MFS transporter [Actinomycetota bacterium]|nr:MFS transporter [Actinomycetota bacterium]